MCLRILSRSGFPLMSTIVADWRIGTLPDSCAQFRILLGNMNLLALPLRALPQHRLRPLQIGLGVHANGVVGSLGHIERYSVFEQAELLQALDKFQRRGRQSGKALQSG